QRLDQRGNLREAIDGLREVGRGEQCAAQRNGVYGDQHARDHAEVAEIRQRVRVGGLPYTDHSYEGVFNCILQAWRRSRNSGLAALVGEAGKRLHTARSRNDQVATDLRLWLRDEIDAIRGLIAALIEALLGQAARHAALVMPGFTHLQVAQPVTFGHHLLAYVE